MAALAGDADWRQNWHPDANWTNFPGESGDAVYRALNPGDAMVELAYEFNHCNPCFFEPTGPQNQANVLVAATWENPEIRNLALTSTDQAHPQIVTTDTITVNIEARDVSSTIGTAWMNASVQSDNAWMNQPLQWMDDVNIDYQGSHMRLIGAEGWEPWHADLKLVAGQVMRVTFIVYDRVHHRCESRPYFVKLVR